MVTEFARNAEIDQALRSQALTLGEGDAPISVSAHTGAKVRVYSMIDGEPRDILAIDAQRVMRKRLPDGRPAFWMEGMAGEAPPYRKGIIKCFLHPEFDEKGGPAGFDRTWLDSIGLFGRSCNMSDITKPNKADFRSIFDRDAHMRRAHPTEMRIITEAKETARVAREAEERRLDREAMLTLARANVPRSPEQAEVAVEDEAHCDECTYMGTPANVRRHKTMKHMAVPQG